MTTTEAARYLGVSAARLRRMCIDGDLKAEKRGRDWHIYPSSVEEYKTKREGTPIMPRGPYLKRRKTENEKKEPSQTGWSAPNWTDFLT